MAILFHLIDLIALMTIMEVEKVLGWVVLIGDD
jgi:hypothetical protein